MEKKRSKRICGYRRMRTEWDAYCRRCLNARMRAGEMIWHSDRRPHRVLCKDCFRVYVAHVRTREYCERDGATRENTLTVEQWSEIKERLGPYCLVCGHDDVGPDHVIPLSQGGSNSAENVQPLCFICNRRKGIRVRDFRPQSAQDAARKLQIDA